MLVSHLPAISASHGNSQEPWVSLTGLETERDRGREGGREGGREEREREGGRGRKSSLHVKKIRWNFRPYVVCAAYSPAH